MRDVKSPQERKNEILDAALGLFVEKGFLKTTTQDIINRVGISRGLLYYHFKNKEEILYILVERTMKPLISKIKMIVTDVNLTAVEQMNQFLDVTIISETNNTEKNKVLQKSVSLEANRYMMDRLNHLFVSEITPIFAKIIKKGIKENTMKVNNPDEMATFLMTAYAFVGNDVSIQKYDRKVLENYLKTYKNMLERTLQVKLN